MAQPPFETPRLVTPSHISLLDELNCRVRRRNLLPGFSEWDRGDRGFRERQGGFFVRPVVVWRSAAFRLRLDGSLRWMSVHWRWR